MLVCLRLINVQKMVDFLSLGPDCLLKETSCVA